MRAKQFTRKINEAALGDGDVANAVVSEVIKLIGEGHTEVSPDVITTKVSAALGRPFMLKDLVAANNSSPELQHYIDSINPSKIKFSTDILTVKNQDPMKEKAKAQDGVAKMAARAGSRPRLGESVVEGWGQGQDRVQLPDEPSLYTDGNGPLQEEYNELYAKLVPSMGPADTIEGEVLRAASKIIYRHYNDGDDFNQASFDQLEQYIGKVSSYDDLAHKATEFALKANGNYHPNQGWDSLDVMEYGPEDYDDDYDEDDGDFGDDPMWADDDEVDEGWGYNPPRNIKREVEYEKKQKEKLARYHAENPMEPKPSKTLARLQRISGFNKVSPEEQARVATAVDGYVARGLTFDQALVLAQKNHVDEGWESGPEERAPRERDPDAEYDDMRQQKADAPYAQKEPVAKGYQVVDLTTKQPVVDTTFATKGEAMAYIQQNYGKNLAYRAIYEGRETPLRDREDYQAKKKALQDIQSDPHTAKDPELSAEVIRRLAGLEKQKSELK